MFTEGTHRARDSFLNGTDQLGRLVLQQVRIIGVDRQDRVTRMDVLVERIRKPR